MQTKILLNNNYNYKDYLQNNNFVNNQNYVLWNTEKTYIYIVYLKYSNNWKLIDRYSNIWFLISFYFGLILLYLIYNNYIKIYIFFILLVIYVFIVYLIYKNYVYKWKYKRDLVKIYKKEINSNCLKKYWNLLIWYNLMYYFDIVEELEKDYIINKNNEN